MLEFHRKDFGVIDIGIYAGKSWEDLPINYLEYLISEECNTNKINKEKAKQELKQRKIADGQIYLFDE